MAAKKPRDAADVRRAAPGYSRMLRDAVESLGIVQASLEQPGLKSTTIWRVLNQKGIPTVSAAYRLRLAIQERFPEVELPPPIVTVEGLDHYRWIDLGTRLHRANPKLFKEVLEMASAVATKTLDLQEAKDNFIDLAKPGGERDD